MLEPNLPSPGKRVTNTTLSFKGAKIFQSALEEMAEKGMNYAKKALLVGESAEELQLCFTVMNFQIHSIASLKSSVFQILNIFFPGLFRWPTIKAGECNNGDHQFEAARKPRIPFQRRKKKGNNGEASATVFKRTSKKIEKPGWGVKDSTFPSSSASVNGSNVVMRDKKRESFGVGRRMRGLKRDDEK
nr:uncharacterized protein LOC109176080 [Ipomoea trifida]